MTDVIRYGIIGTGMMGWEHIMNIGLTPSAEVTALADPAASSRATARSLVSDGVLVFEDYRELLRTAPVDAVVIATPNFTHYEVLQDVFRTRKHVLVEKPLCTTVEDCHRVVEAAAHHPGVVYVGMEYRFMRAVQRLLELVRAGAVGRLHMVAVREHRFPFLPKVDDWNRFVRNTGGTLVEKCCHFFDLMTLILRQPPLRVYASAGQDVNHLDECYNGEVPDIIDNAFAIVDYAGGARAMLDLCMFAENSLHEVEIAATGEHGKVQAFEPEDATVLCRRDGSGHQRETFEVDAAIRNAGAHHGSTYLEHLAFQEAIRNNTPPAVSVEDGALAVGVGAAAELSARERRPVEMRELGF